MNVHQRKKAMPILLYLLTVHFTIKIHCKFQKSNLPLHCNQAVKMTRSLGSWASDVKLWNTHKFSWCLRVQSTRIRGNNAVWMLMAQTDAAGETQALAHHSFLLRNAGNGGKWKLSDTHRFPLFCVTRQHLNTQTRSRRQGQGQVSQTESRCFISDAHRHLETCTLYNNISGWRMKPSTRGCAHTV